jgi:restriction system protein
MDGLKYEQKCARRLRRCGYHSVTVTQGSGDQGIDILATKMGRKYGIQCKYYKHPVGNKAVQEARTGALFYECDRAVVMTNTTFTHQARELAGRTDVELWEKNRIKKGPTTVLMEFSAILILILILSLTAVRRLSPDLLSPFIARPDLMNAAFVLLVSDGISCLFGAYYQLMTLLTFCITIALAALLYRILPPSVSGSPDFLISAALPAIFFFLIFLGKR